MCKQMVSIHINCTLKCDMSLIINNIITKISKFGGIEYSINTTESSLIHFKLKQKFIPTSDINLSKYFQILKLIYNESVLIKNNEESFFIVICYGTEFRLFKTKDYDNKIATFEKIIYKEIMNNINFLRLMGDENVFYNIERYFFKKEG